MTRENNRRGNRSDKYQWILLETPFSQELLTEFSDAQGMTGILNSSEYSEELFQLKERLRLAFWRIIDGELTERQREVIRMLADGYTQVEVAKKLSVNQSSITKSVHGNCDYKHGKRVYGGAKKKLRRIADEDSEIKEILARIAEIQSELIF